MMQGFQKEKMRKRNKVHLKVNFVQVIFRNGNQIGLALLLQYIIYTKAMLI